MLVKRADGIVFAKIELENEFNSLPLDNWLKKAIQRAINDFKENVFCGDQIKKERIPKEYVQNYKINNLWWCPLPNGWRLVYSIVPLEGELLVSIIEYFDHKNYERRFVLMGFINCNFFVFL